MRMDSSQKMTVGLGRAGPLPCCLLRKSPMRGHGSEAEGLSHIASRPVNVCPLRVLPRPLVGCRVGLGSGVQHFIDEVASL